MGLADLHIHTTYSWDATSTVQAVLAYTAHHTQLDVIAITDHDRIEGAIEAQELALAYGLEVIPGIEVSTRDGHLLALFVSEPIPPGLSLKETVLRTVDQGGLCVVPHPMMNSRMGMSPIMVRKAIEDTQVANGLVGIEMFNAGLAGAQRDILAIDLADWLPLAKLGCSDAHINDVIGMGATRFPGRSAADLRLALVNRRTLAIGKRQMHWFDFATRYLPRLLWRYTSLSSWNIVLSKPLRHTKQTGMPRSAG